jgi:hypothetical protein
VSQKEPEKALHEEGIGGEVAIFKTDAQDEGADRTGWGL